MIEDAYPYTSAAVVLYLWAAYAFVSGFIAVSKGRDFLLYFVFTLLTSPLVGVPLVIGLSDARKPK